MPQWTLFEHDFRIIDQTLNELIERSGAVSVHLVDRSGQLITSAGRAGDLDPMAFASLIAAEFTANAELARMLGDQGVDAVVSEGKSRSVYSCLLADRVIMATVYDRRSTLGLVRFRANRAAGALDGVFRELLEKVGLGDGVFAEPEYSEVAQQQVDALFGD
jgi:predicted regulator of Ras-like GTPase activity (Roadblock/LC7/MglB family)